MKVRCAFTSCGYNRKRKTGYFCQRKIISLDIYFPSRRSEMMCYNRTTKKGYAKD